MTDVLPLAVIFVAANDPESRTTKPSTPPVYAAVYPK